MKLIFFLFLISFSVFSENFVVSDYGLAFRPLKTWHKKDNNFYYGTDGSSLNIQSEESLIDLQTYVDLMIKKLKNGYRNYKIISRENEIIDSYNSILLTGTFDFYSKKNNINMEFYSIIFNLYGEKIVLTVAYPKTISDITKRKLNDIQKTISFVGIKKQKKLKHEKVVLNWYENKKNNYKLLIPSGYKLKKDGLFISKSGSIIAVVKEYSDLNIKEYFKIYIKKLKKKYKKISIMEENSGRNKGFEVLSVKISTDKMNIRNIFYKKSNVIYILTSSGVNTYMKKIKKSFQNLK